MNLEVQILPYNGRREAVFVGAFMIGSLLWFDGSDMVRFFYTASMKSGVGPMSRDFSKREFFLDWAQSGGLSSKGY